MSIHNLRLVLVRVLILLVLQFLKCSSDVRITRDPIEYLGLVGCGKRERERKGVI